MRVFAYGIIAITAITAAACSLEVAAQSAPAQQIAPTHRYDLVPGIALFKFATAESCKAGEYLLAHTSTLEQKVTWGCGHSWHGIDFFRFADDAIGAIDTVKWVEMEGKPL